MSCPRCHTHAHTLQFSFRTKDTFFPLSLDLLWVCKGVCKGCLLCKCLADLFKQMSKECYTPPSPASTPCLHSCQSQSGALCPNLKLNRTHFLLVFALVCNSRTEVCLCVCVCRPLVMSLSVIVMQTMPGRRQQAGRQSVSRRQSSASSPRGRFATFRILHFIYIFNVTQVVLPLSLSHSASR